jgi:hypothetical protein
VLPLGVCDSFESCSARYVGVREDATPVEARAIFAPELIPTQTGFLFDVPADDDGVPFPNSIGPLEVDCDFDPNVVACEGAASCTLSREYEKLTGTLQVSRTSESITPPSDPMNWTACGVMVDSEMVPMSGCSRTLADNTWSVSIGRPHSVESYEFEATSESFAIGTELVAPLRRVWGIGHDDVVTDCTLTIEEHWPASDPSRDIMQARARCAAPAEPVYWGVPDFVVWDVTDFVIRG